MNNQSSNSKWIIAIIVVISLLLISISLNGILAYSLFNDSEEVETDNEEESKVNMNISEVIITENLVPQAKTSCKTDDDFNYFLDEVAGNIFLYNYNESRGGILVNNNELKATPDDYESGWTFMNSTFVLGNCKFVLLTQRYNFTTGAGYQEKTWLYDIDSDKIKELESMSYDFSSISEDNQSVLLWTTDSTSGLREQFAWLKTDGELDEFNIDENDLPHGGFSTSPNVGRAPIVTNNKGIILLGYIQSNEADTSEKPRLYYYNEDKLTEIATLEDTQYPSEVYFNESNQTLFIFEEEMNIETPSRKSCGTNKCQMVLIGEYKIN